MEIRHVGASGLTTSVVGLGCNNFGMRLDEAASAAVVAAAIDSGITLFDTSDSYGKGASEQFLGAAIGSHRDEVVIATKFGTPLGEGPANGGSSRRYIVWACEQSLRRLGVDHIDLYYQHYHDPSTPVDETLHALEQLVAQGKVRYAGSSNLAGWQTADAAHIAGSRHLTPFVASQIEWNLLNREVEREVVPACRHHGVGIIPYFPLASGLLTGKYARGADYPPGSRLDALPFFRGVATDESFSAVERLSAVALDAGRSLVELAASWLACQEGVASVLMGATSPSQVAQNAEAASWVLTDDERSAVEDALSATGHDAEE